MNSTAHRPALFVSGIDTGVGKTVVSAILRQSLGSSYWKPVQSGDLHDTDSMKVAAWTDGPGMIHPEGARLKAPMSPHASAAREGRHIALNELAPPPGDDPLVIEGAGGLLVPINERDTMLDLMEQLGTPAVLVSRHYLGSINHTLLSLEALRHRGIPLLALVFNGPEDPETEDVILQRSSHQILLRLPPLEQVDAETVAELAATWRPALEGWVRGAAIQKNQDP